MPEKKSPVKKRNITRPLFLTALLILICCPCPALGERLEPGSLVYRGAFRLPDETNASNWEYSGYAMACRPDGDPDGPEDGYPGSIFALGHDHHQMVSEIGIPIPVISKDKNPADLNAARTLQGFHDIRGNMFGELEIPRAGLAYLPAHEGHKSGRLHFCWGQHFQENEPSHGWCEPDLKNPKSAGPWLFNGFSNYTTNDYLFTIPREWAKKHAPGKLLATGRFRDGHWSGRGPALFAYGPWNDGSPPPSKHRLESITPLLLYGIQEPGAIEITSSPDMAMKTFKEADEWSGGAWITFGKKSAVIFTGTKALGDCWYGFANGVRWPTSGGENEKYPKVPPWPYDDRGWWSEKAQAQILFYDTDDLARVAAGTMKPHEPQPYAVMNLDPYLFDPGFNPERAKRYFLGAADYDRDHGLLYIIERRADEDRSIIHVWKIVEKS